MSEELHETLDAVIKSVNYIKARPLNQRLFSSLSQEMGSEHSSLLLYSEVRWLSRGRVLNRVVELQQEIITFLTKQKQISLAEKFSQENFIANVTYLADIFASLNSLNQAMQGPGFTVIDHKAKITAYYKKLNLWKSYVIRNEYDMFPLLKAYIFERNVNMRDTISEQLAKRLEQYYDIAITPTNKQDWMINPFAITDYPELPLRVVENLMDMTAEPSNRLSFASFKETHSKLSANFYFWASMCSVYPTVSKFVIKELIPFATTYPCVAGFSALAVPKTKHRNRSSVEDDM
uniref:zinc finger BED domain-containing protein 5-like n=1 Tax=Styela clava TaxID=7725 RepID=UPI00193AB858|nr:zinc finger BED domain-containing protein 5-like [Styela clava]